jgi:hypothetical protein
MKRLRKNDPNYHATPESASDPTFDLRRGLVWLVIVIVAMIALSLVCAYLR